MSTRPFKTLDEQIEILKLRNLNIADENQTKKILLDNNYYNIINAYKYIFLLKMLVESLFFQKNLLMEQHLKNYFLYINLIEN